MRTLIENAWVKCTSVCGKTTGGPDS